MAIDFSNNEPFVEEEPLVTTSFTREDESEYSLRPKALKEYIGQEKAKGNLEVFIQAAKMRQEPLDHVLLHGPPGLGKTTLSGIIANEMGVNVRITSGPAIEKAGDLAALLTNLNENDIFLWTRFTGSTALWRRFYTLPWRILPSTSLLARGLLLTLFGWICRNLPSLGRLPGRDSCLHLCGTGLV